MSRDRVVLNCSLRVLVYIDMFAFQLLQTFQRAVLRRAFNSRAKLIVRVIVASYTCGCALSDSKELRTPLPELILKCAPRLSYIVTIRNV